MKPSNAWSFSTTLQNIDVNLILREVEEAGANVARITIDGKVYTAFRADHPKANLVPKAIKIGEKSSVIRNSDAPSTNTMVGHDVPPPASEIMVTGYFCATRWCMRAGDHLGTLLDCVVTKVETFQ